MPLPQPAAQDDTLSELLKLINRQLTEKGLKIEKASAAVIDAAIEEGYIGKLHITPANAHECNHLSPLPEGIAEDTTVYADKGYDSKENRQHPEERRLQDGIMRKARRNRPLTEAQTKRNRYLSKTRYVVEQSFGTLHRKFRYARAAYFGLLKVSAQSHLKAMCLNLLKAANRLSVPVAA